MLKKVLIKTLFYSFILLSLLELVAGYNYEKNLNISSLPYSENIVFNITSEINSTIYFTSNSTFLSFDTFFNYTSFSYFLLDINISIPINVQSKIYNETILINKSYNNFTNFTQLTFLFNIFNDSLTINKTEYIQINLTTYYFIVFNSQLPKSFTTRDISIVGSNGVTIPIICLHSWLQCENNVTITSNNYTTTKINITIPYNQTVGIYNIEAYFDIIPQAKMLFIIEILKSPYLGVDLSKKSWWGKGMNELTPDELIDMMQSFGMITQDIGKYLIEQNRTSVYNRTQNITNIINQTAYAISEIDLSMISRCESIDKAYTNEIVLRRNCEDERLIYVNKYNDLQTNFQSTVNSTLQFYMKENYNEIQNWKANYSELEEKTFEKVNIYTPLIILLIIVLIGIGFYVYHNMIIG